MHFDGRAVQTHVFDMNGQDLLLLQPGKDPIQDTGFAPAIHSCVDGMPIAKMFGQTAPFAAILNDIEQGVEQLQIGYVHVAALAWKAISNALKLALG